MKQISVYPSEEEKTLIMKASRLIGLKTAAFVKSCAIRESLKIIQENSEDAV